MAPEPQAEPPAQAEAVQEAPQQQQEGTEQQTEQEPPASPPLPQRHTAVSPGPRAARLQELYARSLKKTLGKIGWENVAGCYPTVAKRAEGVLKQVQGQMVDKLGEKCEKEFENIMVSRQVVPKLNDLESLISDASHRRAESTTEPPTPPHMLPPSTILAAHLTPTLTAHQSQLNARLQTTQSQNALLHDEVQRQREEIRALLDALEAVVADVQGANDALRPIVDDVAAETRQGIAAVDAASGGGQGQHGATT
ncbi:Nnf1-domain-containing protein [Fusarium flagelliforme]|uniref:Nnf1-domain-containing protein n=1 Tax=Fusarium flagelliforme TaxID=2675880 RepID=UPI001E8DE092|nr:Nnf1-domain-containing protein [Fusarium flagelliforme]KAH7188375.1 Nnf1-domain-containing protein [Fusarium flagelliforme]